MSDHDGTIEPVETDGGTLDYEITLKLHLKDRGTSLVHPRDFDWRVLLDLHPDESVTVVSDRLLPDKP